MAKTPHIINSTQNRTSAPALCKLTKDQQRLPFICIFCSWAHMHMLSSIGSFPLAEASLFSHNSVCCACHLLDAATNLLTSQKLLQEKTATLPCHLMDLKILTCGKTPI